MEAKMIKSCRVNGRGKKFPVEAQSAHHLRRDTIPQPKVLSFCQVTTTKCILYNGFHLQEPLEALYNAKQLSLTVTNTVSHILTHRHTY